MSVVKALSEFRLVYILCIHTKYDLLSISFDQENVFFLALNEKAESMLSNDIIIVSYYMQNGPERFQTIFRLFI